jgi:hypothetical protein
MSIGPRYFLHSLKARSKGALPRNLDNLSLQQIPYPTPNALLQNLASVLPRLRAISLAIAETAAKNKPGPEDTARPRVEL